MLDRPDKTRALIVAMKAELPFEVALTPELIAHFAGQQRNRLPSNQWSLSLMFLTPATKAESSATSNLLPPTT